MTALLQDLVRHKGYANASLIRAIRDYPEASGDEELRTLLHHILVADRFWAALILGLAFDHEAESRVPESIAAVVERYRETHDRELAWISGAQQSDWNRVVETAFIPGCKFSVAQAVMQVCLHSQGHRAQAAGRLRSLGGTPPATDFVMWLGERRAAEWG